MMMMGTVVILRTAVGKALKQGISQAWSRS